MSKLNLDRDKIQSCRQMAKRIAERVYSQVEAYTTASIERATLRFLGIEDAYEGLPVVNHIVASIPQKDLSRGIAYWFGRGLVTQRSSPISLALRVAGGKLSLTDLPEASPEDIEKALEPLVKKGLDRLHQVAKRKKDMESRWPSRSRPLKYLSVGTGDIHQDIEQAVIAAQAGADCIGLFRSAGQSLMEHIPHGETSEGNQGTYVTQANFRLLRKALDEVSAQQDRYIRLVGHSSGLCMPEVAVIGSFENVDYLLNDALYGILFRDIHAKRAYADQQFARLILAHSGVIINTGENNYLAHAESYRVFPQALASHFMNEQFSFLSRLQEWQMGFSHAYEIDPDMEDGFLHEVAQAQTVRECFPKAPIKYMPPTRHKTGDIFYSQLMDGLFSMVGAMTHQDIQQLGSATEAIHHPLVMDRFWSLKAANYVLQNTRSLGDEIQWSQNGKVVRRGRSVLDGAFRILQKIEKAGGLFKAIADGQLANVSRDLERGLGGDHLIEQAGDYFNPVWKALVEESPRDLHIAPASHRRFSGSRSRPGERGGRNERGGRPEKSARGRGAQPGRGGRGDKRSRGDKSTRGTGRRGGRSRRDKRETPAQSQEKRSNEVAAEELAKAPEELLTVPTPTSEAPQRSEGYPQNDREESPESEPVEDLDLDETPTLEEAMQADMDEEGEEMEESPEEEMRENSDESVR